MRAGWLLIVLFFAFGGVARADVFDDNPAVVSVGAGDVYVFARAGDGVIVSRHLSNGSWGDWAPVPGLVTGSGPGAVVYGSSIWLFARGGDGAVWQNQLVSGNWLGWISLGGQVTSAPTAALRPGTTTVDLVARAVDNTLHRREFGAGWSGWLGLRGNFGAAPMAVGYRAGQSELLAREAGGALYWLKLDGTAQEWTDLGGGIKGAPTAASPAPDRLDVYVRALDDTLHYRPLETAAWQRVDYAPLSSAPAATSDQRGREFVFALTGGQLQYVVGSVNGPGAPTWSGWTSLGAIPSVSAPAVTPPPVVAPDTDRDGVPDTGDRCVALAGPAARSGCPTGLLADPSIRYRASRKSIRVLAYYVKATRGARVVVTCSRGCRRSVVTGRGAKAVKITRLSGRRLTNGTKITVTASLAGRLTTTVVDRVSRGRRIEGRPACSVSGTRAAC